MDKLLGDPARLPHPVVYFGRWIAFGEKHLNTGSPLSRWLKGGAFATLSIIGVLLGMTMLMAFLRQWWWLHLAVTAVMVFYCLAGTTLIREVRWVFEATERSLDEGRRQVGRIVGRNTEQLTREEIHAAALETLAENLSDGVIAPLFWFALLGVPGMLAYKMVNTLDSMIAYHTERYKDFGCWAAYVDDAANYIPARLTALLMVVVSHISHRGTPTAMSLPAQLRFVWKFGPQHASPNSGWPEAALASTLDCRFGGPHFYFGEYFPKPYIGTNERPFTMDDMRCATAINLYAEVAAVVVVAVIGWCLQ